MSLPKLPSSNWEEVDQKGLMGHVKKELKNNDLPALPIKAQKNVSKSSNHYHSGLEKHQKGLEVLTKSAETTNISNLPETRTPNLADDYQPTVEQLKPLNHKELAFVNNYLSCLDPCQAAISSGYSEGTAKTRSYSWVKFDSVGKHRKPHIAYTIAQRQKKNLSKAQREADKIVQQREVKRLIDAQYVLDESEKFLKKSAGEIPTHTTVETNRDGELEEVEHFAYDAKAIPQALNLIGKNKLVGAFDNKLEVEASGSLETLLDNINSSVGLPKDVNTLEHDSD